MRLTLEMGVVTKGAGPFPILEKLSWMKLMLSRLQRCQGDLPSSASPLSPVVVMTHSGAFSELRPPTDVLPCPALRSVLKQV